MLFGNVIWNWCRTVAINIGSDFILVLLYFDLLNVFQMIILKSRDCEMLTVGLCELCPYYQMIYFLKVCGTLVIFIFIIFKFHFKFMLFRKQCYRFQKIFIMN